MSAEVEDVQMCSEGYSLHLLICREHESWRPHIAGAVLRIGTAASAPLNSLEHGAISARIGIDDGVITHCAYASPKGPQRIDHHPDTGRRLIGTEIPNWSTIRDQVISFFDQSNYLRVAGFDLLLCEDGAALLGGSNTPDVGAIQIHGPLLDDPVFAEFVRREKI